MHDVQVTTESFNTQLVQVAGHFRTELAVGAVVPEPDGADGDVPDDGPVGAAGGATGGGVVGAVGANGAM